MKKQIQLTAFILLIGAQSLFGAITLRYFNKDSRAHTFKVKIDGVVKEITFDPGKTASVTIQGGAKEAILISGCGETKIKDNDKVEIEKGCLTVK